MASTTLPDENTDCTHAALSPSHSRRDLTLSSRRSFPGLEDVYGYVTVEEEPLEVYGIKQEGSKTIAYIEAKEGKQFEVVFVERRSKQQVKDLFSLRIFVDGAK
jgi:hypothetical protein